MPDFLWCILYIVNVTGGRKYASELRMALSILAFMHACIHARTYVRTFLHICTHTYVHINACIYVHMYTLFLCMYTYICRGELYACDKVINGLLFMLFNAYIIINVSYCWLRSQIIILWLKGRDRWHCICYKDICVKRYNQPPVVISGGGYLIMINLVLVVCSQSVIHIFLCVIRESLINNHVR